MNQKNNSKSSSLSSSILNHDELEAIVSGNYENIFAVLGMHQHPSGKGLLVRAFLPWANSVDIVNNATGKKIATLKKVHSSGVFEAALGNRKNRFAYHFIVNGDIRIDDPYQFPTMMDESQLYYFNEGTAEHAYRWLGAHSRSYEGVDGVLFTLWAPSAKRVSVVGDFNGWDGRQHVMRKHPASGIWEIFIPGVGWYANYKFEMLDARGRQLPLKADPFARSMQHPPQTASRVVLDDSYNWTDNEWMANRQGNHLDRPVSIYEVHVGSWRRKHEEGNRYISYHELVDELIPYVLDMGFTHIQLMPISEYPFDGSWGYQPVGMYAPTIRYGTPDEFRYFVNECHRHNLGVLLDWVPGHFPTDPHGLGKFDGTCLYEHEDVRKGFHPDWNTLIYNYGRGEVLSYLLSNANYWIEEFHLDGLRVDAVASMLYLDYSRKEGEWLPNEQGGRENLEAINMLRSVNARVYKNHPGIMMIAEESTAWPGVSKPVDQGGLGFGYKWNMGWMNDSTKYMEKDPVYRKHHQGDMTFSIVYAFNENFILPLSHDEVVHGKGSLLTKMPGDDWQKFANLRAYFGFMWAHPGKKLLFMGGELAQRREWDHDTGLDWHLLDSEMHRGVNSLVRDLNNFYRQSPALHELDSSADGFSWLQHENSEQSIFSWLRRGREQHACAVIVSNMTPNTHHDYRVGVPMAGWYKECINTDARDYGGSGQGNRGGLHSDDVSWNSQPCSLSITVPPLSTVIFEFQPG